MSPEMRSRMESLIGTWEVDGDLIEVSLGPKGGLVAKTEDGREVGAGMVFAGRKVSGPPPETPSG